MTSSGGVDTRDLPAVAADVELAVSQNQAETYRGRKIKSVGSLKVVWAKPSAIGKPVGGHIVTASVEACIDASGVDAIDSTGKSVRKPGTPARWIDTRQLKLFGEQWKVVKGKNEAAKC
ncbi:hypothetical protein [Kribbella yunnanensis]